MGEDDETLLSSGVAWCSRYFFAHAYAESEFKRQRVVPGRGQTSYASLLDGLAVVRVTISSQSPGA